LQSLTVLSDSQITAVTNADALAPENVATRVYLTTTGFPPERANLGQPFPPFFMEANAGPNNPGTPTFSGTTDPTVPRITGMKPNQGPTIGAPTGPSQNFTNDPITLWGCGFSGATAVLFGSTASPSFTVQSDTVSFATPPTPASGTGDVTVVTPRGTSSIGSLDRYSYLPPPAITSITPSGTVCGGSTITLNGSGFSNVNAVTLFTNPMQSFTVVSDSQITAVTNADALAPENDATRVYLTTTAVPPERANLVDPFPRVFMED